MSTIVSRDYLQGALTNFRATFENDFAAAENGQDWARVTMMLDAKGRFMTHQWLGSVPSMQDVSKGDLELEAPDAYNYTRENLTFKAGFEVERSTFEDDELGTIRPKISQLGEEAARHPGQLIFELFRDGASGLAFDNVAFFANTRVLGDSANIDNLAAGSGITVANILADLSTNRGTMRRFQDDKGRPMNLVGNAVMVPPELEGVMYQALQSEQSANPAPAIPAEQAITSRGYPIVVNPYLTDLTDWYLIHFSPFRGPAFKQNRLNPTLEGITNPETDSGVIRDKFVYTARARYNVGYGDPRTAIRIVNA